MDCVVCCEPLRILARYPCGHMLCYKCAAKLVFQYADKQCPLCKSSAGKPVFMSDRDRKQAGLEEEGTPSAGRLGEGDGNIPTGTRTGELDRVHPPVPEESNLGSRFARMGLEKSQGDGGASRGKAGVLGIKTVSEDEHAGYASEYASHSVKNLLAKKCQKCKEVVATNKELEGHYKERHNLLLCDMCLEHGKRFWFEIHLYTPNRLILHKKGKLKEPGFSGHFYCIHCAKYLYNSDEGKRHCHMEHQLCTICESLGIKFQFYKSFKELEDHYRARHYCCRDPVCTRNLCYVYAYKSELWTHCISTHSLDLTLSDITTGILPNPPVCSIDSISESSQPDLYHQHASIVTPLVNEPYFPSFATSSPAAAASPTTSTVPSFMDRAILHQSEGVSNIRLRQISLLTKTFRTEINNSVEDFIAGTKRLQDMVGEIEASVGNQVCLRILENISFLHRAKEIREFLKGYKQSVMFPSFKKDAPRTTPPIPKKKNDFGTFKILDLTKKRGM